MVLFANKQRVLGYGVGVVEYDVGEDVALRERFGTKWDDWAKSVPYSICPGIY